MIVMHGLPNCDTCRKARSWLREHEVEHRFSDYREHPMEPTELLRIAGQLGWTTLVNRASLTWRQLPEADRSPATSAEWLALVKTSPTLLKRPLLILPDGRAVAGFKAAHYAELFER